MHDNDPQDNGSPEVNQVTAVDEHVEVKVGDSTERLVNNLRNNGPKEEANDLSGNTSQFHVDAQRSNGPLVRWERFLPVKSLKVLLVENDDSTRHVVSALLRNCSYEVTAVSNGYQAWKILEDLNNQIDLVLTEVVMPGLSGIGLLSKIMNHKTCKNLPVIMMSSHDSMGIVFKCLSKGAVDFLVKPLRKNELKNLWQHVWRKCHSSSGSGSESGVRTEKSSKSRSGEDSENEIASSEEYDGKNIQLSLHGGSDNGSGTQSSWTKRAAEVESPRAGSPWEQLSDPPDSTCAQVISSRPEAFASSWVQLPAEEHKGLDDQVENVTVGRYSQLGPSGNPEARKEFPETMILVEATANPKDSPVPAELKNDGPKFDKPSSGIGSLKLKVEATTDLKAVCGGKCDLQRGVGLELPCGLSEISKNKDKSVLKNKELPSLELTLKRTGDAGDIRPADQDQNTLRRSELSAFTKYRGGGSAAKPAQTGNVGSCSPLDNSSDAAKTDSNPNQQFNSCRTPLNQGSNNSSNNNDMGSTTYRSFTKETVEMIDKPSAKTTAQCLADGGSITLPNEGGLKPSSQIIICDKNKASPVHTVVIHGDSQGKEVQVQHHHHHYHHHHHHHHVKQLNPDVDEDESSQQDVVMETVQCGSSNGERNPVATDVVGNFNVNRSASGSNHGGNTPNGNVAPVKAEGVNVMNVKCEAGEVSVSGSGTGVDQSHSAQREAALNKFRLKRKERCFEKKVRYQSRKKLAAQRPRVRGQFVKQNQESKSSDDTDS